MTAFRWIVPAVVVVAAAVAFQAQQTPEFPQPVVEHKWLEQFVGEWDATAEAVVGPDQPAMKVEGKAAYRMLGGFWVVGEMQNTMADMNMQAVQTIGYDPQKKKYIGTWVDSMTNHLWHYEGTVDEAGKKITLEAEGPDMMQPGKTSKYRDAYEFKSPDLIVATSSMQGDDGAWVSFMTGEMKRTK